MARQRRFTTEKILGEAREDFRCTHLMFRGRMAVLRGFYKPKVKK